MHNLTNTQAPTCIRLQTYLIYHLLLEGSYNPLCEDCYPQLFVDHFLERFKLDPLSTILKLNTQIIYHQIF